MSYSTSADPTYSQLLRMGWLVFWRLLALLFVGSFVVVPVMNLGVTGILASLGVPPLALQIVLAVLFLAAIALVVFPVLVQMLLQKTFRGFEVQPTAPDGEPYDLSYREGVLPGLVLWVTPLLIGILPTVALQMLVLAATSDLALANSPGWGLLRFVWLAFAAYPASVWLLFRMPFPAYRLRVRREDPDAWLAGPSASAG